MARSDRKDRKPGTPSQSESGDPPVPRSPLWGGGAPSNGSGWGQWQGFVALSLAIVLFFHFTDGLRELDHKELSYTEFREAVRDGHVSEVILRGQNIQGHFSEAGRQYRELSDPATFETLRPELEDQRLLGLLDDHDVDITAQPVEPAWWQRVLLGALPWILLLGLLFWASQRFQQRMMAGGGAGGPMGIGKSAARRIHSEESDVRLDDVAGSDNAKKDIMEVVDFLKDPARFRKLGATMPRGILMMGPPGTGKTLMAKAVAGEAGVPFFTLSGSEFIEMFVGVGASRVRDLFKQAKEQAPAVIFIDELDSIGRSRGAGMGGGHDEREQTLNQILSEMDGFEGHESVVVLAATNRPDVLDAALMRPGRFDRKITLERPHKQARREILDVHVRKVPLADDVDLDRLAAGTTGFSGADLSNLVNEAALLGGRRELDRVDWGCFSDARDRILLGEARESLLSDRERKVVAYHESGHALLAWLLPEADSLEKVTVIPRGQALGVTAQVPDEERYNFNEGYLHDRMAVMFGGRLAESIVFEQVSSGAENDLRQATQLARRMVAHWGMNERIGPAAFPQGQEHVFLGKELGQGREHSEATAALIDEEVQKLVREVESRARRILEENRQMLEQLAQALLDRETLEVNEIREVLGEAGQGSSA
ncbi:ATP-dependent zinc metalloprotease FtsH [Ectothiorhodospira haloalkaliphila]|uniref:ATP-dependent zinc metalloprotease FtsH n=1 Tax=Ectothiorhodospira haloalkaliphila TaxID=421628 RepID=UPI00047D9E02